MKKQVYFNEYNPYLSNTAYLPLVAGKLVSYALQSDIVREHYEFPDFLFKIEEPEKILAQYDNPSVAAFSCMMWNERLCLHVAREVKRCWPDCVIVFGGTQVPHNPTSFMQEHDFIDACIVAEGEEPFRKFLEHLALGRSLETVARTYWRDDTEKGLVRIGLPDNSFSRDLDEYPSPYLDGLYESIMDAHPDMRFQAIIETNRGCPFLCTFCYWGKGGLSRKYRYFSLERVQQEMEWIGQNDIGFVYNADSNFGMHRRDEEIADYFVDTKAKYGFPEKVVNLYGKNTNERIFEIAQKLFKADMHKGVGLSRQSMSPEVLTAIKRDNIKLEVYDSLQKKFEANGIPTFCEILIGLPGETYQSFLEGVDELWEAAPNSQLIIILAEVYPNTEMGDVQYQQDHGMVVKRNVAHGVHASFEVTGTVDEYIDYVIETNTLPFEDWVRSGVFAWAGTTLLSLRASYYFFLYMRKRYGIKWMDFLSWMIDHGEDPAAYPFWTSQVGIYRDFMMQIADGRGRGLRRPEYDTIYWAVEEVSFLDISSEKTRFFAELGDMALRYLSSHGIAHDKDEVMEALIYQEMRMPSIHDTPGISHTFETNVAEYLEDSDFNSPIQLERKATRVYVEVKDFKDERAQFARERVLWARRGGKMEWAVSWETIKPKRPKLRVLDSADETSRQHANAGV